MLSDLKNILRFWKKNSSMLQGIENFGSLFVKWNVFITKILPPPCKKCV